MKVWIVVEGESDLAVVKRVLSEHTKAECEFIAAGGRSNITSVARTLRVKHQEPVALLRDADSLEPAVIREKYTTTEQLLQSVSGGAPFKVILCIPELEAVFFAEPEILDRLFPKAQLSALAFFYLKQPKQVLAHCFANGGGPTTLTQLLEALTEDDRKRLRAAGPIRELSDFVEAVVNPIATL